MSFLRESVKSPLPSTKNRKDNSCKDKNEGILHILAPDFFSATLMAKEHFIFDPRLTYTDFNSFLHFESMKSYNVIE